MVVRLFSLSILCVSCGVRTDVLIVGGGDDATPTDDTSTVTDTATDTGGGDSEPDSATEPELAGTRALLVTESPYGSNPDPSTWGGVRRYTFGESGALLKPATGIDADALHDPWGLAWRETSQELFVGNRHGNFAVDGVVGSIQRFVYDSEANTFAPNGTITGDELAEVHQLSFDPSTGELFAANGERGISRFTFDGNGVAVSNGTVQSGTTRGVVVSPGGRKVWATSATEYVRQFDIGTWSERTPVGTEKGAVLQNLAIHDGLLYAPGFTTNAIYRFRIDAKDDLLLLDSIAATSPVCVTFSRDGRRMYAAGPTMIERFAFDEETETWVFVEAVASDTSLGSMVVLE